MSLLSNLRFYVLSFSFIYSIGIYFWVEAAFASEQVTIIRMQQIYALTSVTFLYLTLLAGPLCYSFKFLPFREKYMFARRALGVSAFYFGLLHALISFFFQLGGFYGLGYLSNKYLLAITLSFTALMILTTMAVTSFDKVRAWMGFKRWKMLHRLVYLAAVFILIHALMLGTHFQDLSGIIPQILFTAVGFLMLLEAARIDAFLQRKFNLTPSYGLAQVFTGSIILAYLFLSFIPAESPLSLGIHAQHIKLAQQAQQPALQDNLPNIPGLKGDKSKRFSVDLEYPKNILSNQEIPFIFKVYDASSGNQVNLFETIYEKRMHMIVADSALNYYNHIHPEQSEDSFSIKTSFPKEGVYHIYLDFQPLGAIEQQFAFNVNVGQFEGKEISKFYQDKLTKSFGNYEVSMDFDSPLEASRMSVGAQEITFTVKDASTKKPITTLKPYLASFGHLVMINKDTFDYLHVHPANLVAPSPNQNGGPEVAFLPVGIYGPFKPGVYRVFAQFNPDNNLITADFTVEVK